MTKSLITINTSVVHSGPAAPILIFFDDGRWEIDNVGNLDYIVNGYHGDTPDPAYVGSAALIDLIDEYRASLDYDVSERDENEAVVFLSETVDVGSEQEPVFILFADGDVELVDRYIAEDASRDDEDFVNFVSVDDLISELREFVSNQKEQ